MTEGHEGLAAELRTDLRVKRRLAERLKKSIVAQQLEILGLQQSVDALQEQLERVEDDASYLESVVDDMECEQARGLSTSELVLWHEMTCRCVIRWEARLQCRRAELIEKGDLAAFLEMIDGGLSMRRLYEKVLGERCRVGDGEAIAYGNRAGWLIES